MSKLAAPILALYQKHPMLIALGGLLILTIPISIFFGANVQKLHQSETPRVQENKTLIVNQVNPSGFVADPKRLTITFSDPVDEHTFLHYFTISPQTEGSVLRGEHPNQLIFIPLKPFEKGTMYSIRIVSGLASKNGKILIADHYGDFSTEPAAQPIVQVSKRPDKPVVEDRVDFIKDEVAVKVLSFPAGKPVSFSTRVKGINNNAPVRIYKSDQAHLLNYLVYTKDQKYEDDFYSYGDKFNRDSMPHSEKSLIESFEMKNDGEKQLQLAPGVYYMEAGNEKVIGSSFIIVNTVGVSFRQDDKKIIFSTFDVHTGKKVSYPSNLGLYNLENVPKQLATLTYNEIETNVPFSFNNRLDAVVGTINGESIFIPVRLPQSFADIQATKDLDKAKKIFLYTERPLYKPKDRVFFRGVVKVDGDALYKVPPEGLPLRVFLGYEKNPEINMRVQTDENGIFSGSFVLPDSIKGSETYFTYPLYASTDLTSETYTYGDAFTNFDVINYVKPEFEIKTAVNSVEMIRHDKAVFTISANYFNGQPYKNQELTYEIYEDPYYETERTVYNKNFNITSQGGMCGGGGFNEYYGNQIQAAKTVKLDNYGRAEVTFSLPDDNVGSKKLTLVAKKKDKVGNEITSAVNTTIHGAKFNIFFMPSAQIYAFNDEVIAPFYAEMLNGEKLGNKEFTYRYIETDYDTKTYKTIEKTMSSGTVTTDSNGRGIVKFVPKSKSSRGSNYVVVEAKDDKGNTTDARKYLSIRESKEVDAKYAFWQRGNIEQTYLTITSSQNNFKVGDKIVLKVLSPKDIDVLLSLERGRLYYPRLVALNKGENTVEITAGEDLSPSITVMFSFFVDGQYHTEGLSLNVPAMHKVLQVNVKSDKEKYKPNENALVKITTKDADSDPVPAKLSMSVVDKALLTLRPNAAPPIHSEFYYFRNRSTNASSSLTWVGDYGAGGGGGGGGIPFVGGQAVDTLYWNPNITTDATGETVVSVPLEGFKTTWKALVIGSTDNAQFGQGDTEFIVAD